MLELATGEGKSLVIAAIAVIKSLQGFKVDIACSSPILAVRDMEEWRDFYKFFELESSVITSTSRSMVKEVYKRDIVYGTVHEFSADVLKQEFDKNITRDKRQFECLIIDEVDNLTIDNCLHETLLSSKATGMHHLNSLFITIWQHVIGFFPIPGENGFFNSPQFFVNAIQSLLNVETVESDKNNQPSEESFLDGFFGILDTISKDKKLKSLEQIRLAYEQSQTKEQFLNESRDIMRKEFSSMEEFSFEEKILNILTETFEIIANFYVIDKNNHPKLIRKTPTTSNRIIIFPNGDIALYYSNKEAEDLIQNEVLKTLCAENKIKTKEDREIFIPLYLHQHVRKMTPKFIKNAFSVAYVLNEGEHYKISKSLDSNGSDNSQYDSAISIDLVSTGMLQKTMKYSGGIQQFLEMKHQLALSEPTLTTNFMSNFCFYKRFKNIYGLSGTLGNDSDKSFLREELELTSQKIPSHKGSSTRFLEPLIEEEEDVWRSQVIEDAVAVAMRGQAVLIICKDMNNAETFHEYLLKKKKYDQQKIIPYWKDDVHNLPDKVQTK